MCGQPQRTADQNMRIRDPSDSGPRFTDIQALQRHSRATSLTGKVGDLRLSKLVHLTTSSNHPNDFTNVINDCHEQSESF